MNNLLTLEIELQQFDYYHDHSDHHAFWKHQTEKKALIEKLVKELYTNNTEEIDNLFKLYWSSRYINWKKYFNVE